MQTFLRHLVHPCFAIADTSVSFSVSNSSSFHLSPHDLLVAQLTASIPTTSCGHEQPPTLRCSQQSNTGHSLRKIIDWGKYTKNVKMRWISSFVRDHMEKFVHPRSNDVFCWRTVDTNKTRHLIWPWLLFALFCTILKIWKNEYPHKNMQKYNKKVLT